MIGLVVIIVCIALSVFCYKKMANRCRVKGRGKLTTFFISLSSSSLVFLVSMIIGVANFFPEAESESGKVSNDKTEKNIVAEKKQDRKDLEYTLIVKDSLTNSSDRDIILKFEKNNEFELSVLKEIQSYQNESFQHYRAAMMFRDYGVRLSDFDKLIRPKCSESIDELDHQYKNETASWQPYSWYKDKDLLEEAHKYRENYHKVFFEEKKRQQKKMIQCFYDLSQEIPNHSPRQKPDDYQK
ncbi:hypothetical protein [Yersinia massiliensis]|uniref:hypothetical protein n=1 Tax=Yersinia massiliensis TaxID=419257 RepID=UPI000C160538|nr:hypothetical protein [Yersinia massiliensis]PHZ21490.1 hypothetical protein CS535_22335 [Yersinia massiliensis]